MESYEIVFYEHGSSVFHKINDDAQLRPDVEEVKRIIVRPERKPKKYLYYVWTSGNHYTLLNNKIFTSYDKLQMYCRENGLRLGHDCFYSEIINCKYCDPDL